MTAIIFKNLGILILKFDKRLCLRISNDEKCGGRHEVHVVICIFKLNSSKDILCICNRNANIYYYFDDG